MSAPRYCICIRQLPEDIGGHSRIVTGTASFTADHLRDSKLRRAMLDWIDDELIKISGAELLNDDIAADSCAEPEGDEGQ